MDLLTLEQHLERIDRDLARTALRKGDGWSYKVKKPDRTLTYTMTGVLPLPELDDHVKHALGDLWNLKDYLWKMLKADGRDPSQLEARINKQTALRRLSDLANAQKHGGFDKKKYKPRTGQALKFGTSKYVAKSQRDPATGKLIGTSIQSIAFGANDVRIDIDKPEDRQWFEFKLPVLDEDGDEIDDAAELLVRAYADWKVILTEYGYAWPGRTP